MDIKKITEQKKIFKEYTDNYINDSDDKTKSMYQDKQQHSIFVMEEALLIDALFTEYNKSFKNLLALESLFHDIGRFEQLKVSGTFSDDELNLLYPSLPDHGELGAIVMDKHGLLKSLIPDVRLYDEEVKKTIRLHSKINPDLLEGIMRDYLKVFKNYDLKELFLSNKTEKEIETLTKINTSIIQDADRLDIFRKVVRGIWTPMVTEEKIDPELFVLFKQGKLPSISEIKKAGKWNANIGHLVRMSFINQMNLVPVLLKIRNENLIDKMYEISGNEVVLPAYEYAKKQLDEAIEKSEDGMIIKRGK